MQRNRRSFLEEKIAWWFTAGQFLYLDNPIHGLSITFAYNIFDVIDFVYNEYHGPIYDELMKNEQDTAIDGIPESKSKTLDNIYTKYQNGLLEYDWDKVLCYMIKHRDRIETTPEIKYFLHFKGKLLEYREKIREKYCCEQIVEKIQGATIGRLLEYNIQSTHWIYRVFNNYYYGSCYDIVFSPLFTLVNIGKDISRNINEISNVLYHLDGLPNESDRSILVVLKEYVRTFDEVGWIALDAVLNADSNENITHAINTRLTNKGIPPKHRFIVNTIMQWICTKGCLKNTYTVYDETKNVLAFFHAWQPVGTKFLLDHP